MQSGKLCSAGRNGPGDALGFALAADLDEYLRRQRWSNRALAIRTQRSSQQPRALAPLPDDAQRDRTAERRAANDAHVGTRRNPELREIPQPFRITIPHLAHSRHLANRYVGERDQGRCIERTFASGNWSAVRIGRLVRGGVSQGAAVPPTAVPTE